MSLKRTVLCVDGDAAALAVFRKMFKDAPYLLLTASSLDDAKAMIDASPVHVAIIDISLCDKDAQFLRDLRESHPCLVRVVSAQTELVENILDPVVHGDAHRFLVKPWKERDVLVTIGQCVEYHDLVRENREMVSHIHAQNEELSRFNEQLEKELFNRTRLLALSQTFLDNLPVAVIGVSMEGLIVVVNREVSKYSGFFPEPNVGSDIKNSLPSPMARAVERTMKTGMQECFKVYDDQIRVRTAPVCDKTDVNGCVLVLEEL